MAARAEMLGDTGANHPDHWVGGLASPDLHAIVILFARDCGRTGTVPGHARGRRSPAVRASRCCPRWTSRPRRRSTTRTITSATGTACRSRRWRDRARRRRPAPVRRSRPANSSWDIPTRKAHRSGLPQPEVLSRNGSFLAYRRLEEHVGCLPRVPAAERCDARGAGAGGGEAHGTVAKRSAAGAGAGPGRSRDCRGPAAEQRLQLRQGRPARLRGAARLAHPADESRGTRGPT